MKNFVYISRVALIMMIMLNANTLSAADLDAVILESGNYPGNENVIFEEQMEVEEWMLNVKESNIEVSFHLEDWMLNESLITSENLVNFENWMIEEDLIDEGRLSIDEWMFNFDL